MTSRPRIVFFGTPEFAVPILTALNNKAEVVLVVTQPDRPSGRGRKRTSPPAKVNAHDLGIDVIQPEIVKGRRFAAKIATYMPDFVITAAFGRILGPSLLEVPKLASLNVHASLLPRHRGAAPANWAILAGDQETGVSIIKMEQGLDTGPVFHFEKTPVGSEESAGELLIRLAELGAEAIVDTINGFHDLRAVPQDDNEATWARMLGKNDGIVDWSMSAPKLHRQVRGMHPWPTATTLFRGVPLKIHAARVCLKSGHEGQPGLVINISQEGIDVACGDGVLRMVEVQASGRKKLNAAQFLSGARIEPGLKLGQ
ncbi:MAG: methionyl-tRNA formyltransferase [Proteobacteria bacterium]|nr:methionyl-tRNA formyltransferase [Pseudomonadota bacterium]